MTQKEEITYANESSEENFPIADKLKKLKQKLKTCQKEKEEYLLLAQRVQADLVNYRRRQEQIGEEFRKYSQADVIKDLLPILDSLEAGAEQSSKLKPIKKQMEIILQNRGLKEIKVVGEKFNPQFHEAIEITESDKEEGTVVGEVQKGYMLHDKVLRASKVKVSK